MKPDCDNRKTVAFVCPSMIASAVEAPAAQDITTVSHVIRQALVKDLRERGLLPVRPAAA